jgi:hypothetical protein
MIMSLRDGSFPSKQSPVTRGDCFATCARNDMQTVSLRQWWLRRRQSKPQSATEEELRPFFGSPSGVDALRLAVQL